MRRLVSPLLRENVAPLVLIPRRRPAWLVLAMLFVAEFGSGLGPTLWIAPVGAIAGFLWLLPSPIPTMRGLPEPAE